MGVLSRYSPSGKKLRLLNPSLVQEGLNSKYVYMTLIWSEGCKSGVLSPHTPCDLKIYWNGNNDKIRIE